MSEKPPPFLTREEHAASLKQVRSILPPYPHTSTATSEQRATFKEALHAHAARLAVSEWWIEEQLRQDDCPLCGRRGALQRHRLNSS